MALPPPPPLPSRASTARVLLYVLAPFAFLICAGFASQATDAVAKAGWFIAAPLAAAVLVYVGVRVTRSFTPATAPQSGSAVVTTSRWDWTDVLAFLPATFAILTATDLALVSTTQAADGSLSADARTAVESFAAQAAFYAAALLALGILLLARRGLALRDLGWRLPRSIGRAKWWVWIPIAVVAAYVTLVIANNLGALSQDLLPQQQNTQCANVRTEYHGYVAIAIPLVCLIAPLAEETMFRGFFYGWLRRHLPIAPAVIVSAAVFALAHAVIVLALPLFAVGVVLALLYEYSESLIPGAIVHGLFNLVGIIAILGPTAVCQ